jgi:hypothetical protein
MNANQVQQIIENRFTNPETRECLHCITDYVKALEDRVAALESKLAVQPQPDGSAVLWLQVTQMKGDGPRLATYSFPPLKVYDGFTAPLCARGCANWCDDSTAL